jgi:hypothetical protein
MMAASGEMRMNWLLPVGLVAQLIRQVQTTPNASFLRVLINTDDRIIHQLLLKWGTPSERR